MWLNVCVSIYFNTFTTKTFLIVDLLSLDLLPGKKKYLNSFKNLILMAPDAPSLASLMHGQIYQNYILLQQMLFEMTNIIYMSL